MIPAFVTMAIYYGESIKRGDPLEWQRYAAIIIFILAAVSDGLDGYVARRYNQRSALGVYLDPIADKGLLLSGIITLSISNWSQSDPEYGSFPVWFPVLVISRDAVILVGTMILYLLNGKVPREAKLDWKSGDSPTDDCHWMGDAAAAIHSSALRGGPCRRVHIDFGNRLRDRWRSPVAGRRPCAPAAGLTSSS